MFSNPLHDDALRPEDLYPSLPFTLFEVGGRKLFQARVMAVQDSTVIVCIIPDVLTWLTGSDATRCFSFVDLGLAPEYTVDGYRWAVYCLGNR